MIRTKNFLLIAMAMLLLTASYAVAGSGGHSGVVLETATGGGYTYMLINEGGKKFWIAAPKSPIVKGKRVRFAGQVWMTNFKSKAMNRTFDKILFVGAVSIDSSAPRSSAISPSAKSNSKAAKKYSIKEIYSRKDQLRGRPVKVRGKVVKVSKAIMQRNWVHIEDGTGDAGSNKLIFRSKNDSAAVGSVVTAQGILATDKDFGYGYFYPVIVEDATFSK